MCNGAKIKGIFEDSKFLGKKCSSVNRFLPIKYNNVTNTSISLKKYCFHPHKKLQ